MSYKGLVDDEVLAAEQVRIRAERAKVEHWALAAGRNLDDISAALEDALALLNDPGTAYAVATPVVRRMMNQALFVHLWMWDDDVIDAEPTRWVERIEAVGRTRERAAERRDPRASNDNVNFCGRLGPQTTRAPEMGALV